MRNLVLFDAVNAAEVCIQISIDSMYAEIA
jgi:hypothetical protein